MKDVIDLLIECATELKSHSGSAYCGLGKSELIDEVFNHPKVLHRFKQIVYKQKQVERDERLSRTCKYCRKLLKSVDGRIKHETDKHGEKLKGNDGN